MRNSEYVTRLISEISRSTFTFQDLAGELVKAYKVDDKEMDQALELKLSKSTRVYPMDKVSNSSFTLVRFSPIDGTSCCWIPVSKSSIFGRPPWPQMGSAFRQNVILSRKRRSYTNYQHSQWQKWVLLSLFDFTSENLECRVISTLCSHVNLNSSLESPRGWSLWNVQDWMLLALSHCVETILKKWHKLMPGSQLLAIPWNLGLKRQ